MLCSLSNRSVIWLQTNVAPLTPTVGADHDQDQGSQNYSSLSSQFRRTETTRLASNLATYLIGQSNRSVHGLTRSSRRPQSVNVSNNSNVLSLDRFNQNRGTCDCSNILVGFYDYISCMQHFRYFPEEFHFRFFCSTCFLNIYF